MTTLDETQKNSVERHFVLAFAIGAGVVAALPALFALVSAQHGARYLGFEFGTDDHMVYSAWMRQAMDGRFLFDNRFATDPQPGLTIHLYFWVLGLAAKLLGIALAANLARIGLSLWFVYLLYGLVRRLTPEVGTTKLCVTFATLGGGIGFLVWHTFGRAIVLPAASWASGPMLGKLPTDVWQPEGYAFASMLTNGLFMAALCLILFVLQCAIDARESWKPVLPGAAAMLVLMNVHSYDALLVALAFVGLAVAAAASGSLTRAWALRAAVIGAGAVPSALWFAHVLNADIVFQQRAATPTFAPNFREVVFGYLPLIVLAIVGFARRETPDARRKWIGLGTLGVLYVAMFVAAANNPDGYFMSPAVWVLAMAATLVACALLATESAALNLVTAWALVGTVAQYFPALFQRKLAMGLAVPWAILAALGVAAMMRRTEQGLRSLATLLLIVVVSASSLRWALRDVELIKLNVSNTTMQPVYIGSDVDSIVAYLSRRSAARTVVLAMPGVADPLFDGDARVPDAFETPLVPDLNPILSGFGGVYTYAGHWSETPDYAHRRNEESKFFLSSTSTSDRQALIDKIGASYVVAPVPEAFAGLPLADLRSLGRVVVEGDRFRLIKVGG